MVTPPAAHERNLQASTWLDEAAKQLQGGLADAALPLIHVALEIDAQNPRAHQMMGLACLGRQQPGEAVRHLVRAAELAPDSSDIHNDLAIAHLHAGDVTQARIAIEKAVVLAPNAPIAQNTLASVCERAGDLDGAIKAYRRAIVLAPKFPMPRIGLARVYERAGDHPSAFKTYAACLAVVDAPEIRGGLLANAAAAPDIVQLPDLEKILSLAVEQTWIRLRDIHDLIFRAVRAAKEADALVRQTVAAWPARPDSATIFAHPGYRELAASKLFRHILSLDPIVGRDAEIALTGIRRAFLLRAASDPSKFQLAPVDLAFLCALAKQCFLNEYVWSLGDGEREAMDMLDGHCRTAAAMGARLEPALIAIIAAYRPLSDIDFAKTLNRALVTDDVKSLFAQQIDQAQALAQISSGIKTATPIDASSQIVMQQYEENPYPKWSRVPVPKRVSLNEFAAMAGAYVVPLAEKQTYTALIAGCGTGQQSTEAAMRLQSTQVLAIDLSRASLSYAELKRRELGLQNVVYMQGDIMNVAAIGYQFDLIESTGVLHHMADPFQGWAQLRAKLAPGGLMRIALYSAAARAPLAVIWDELKRKGLDRAETGLKAARQWLLTENNPRDATILTAADFYTTSGCRDLLFHVRERQFTIPEIATMLRALNLRFAGFLLEPKIRSYFVAAFPSASGLYDLDNWHAFETANPGAFGGMYEFLAQDAAA
jgi:SAM-dependent methyltransferase/tetratricopeptide (TPR) repeat protein